METEQKPKKKGEKQYSLRDLKALGQQLLSSRSHVNNLPRLLSFIDPSSPPQYALESLLSLQSFFTPLLPDLPSTKLTAATCLAEDDDAAEAAELIYRTWLRSKLDDFLSSLIILAVSSQSKQALREVALDTVMEFVKIGNRGKFHSAIYHRFLQSTINSSFEVDDMLLDLLTSKYFKYIDIRYFTYISLDKMTRNLEVEDISDDKSATLEAHKKIQSRERELSIHKIYFLLSNIPLFHSSDEKCSYEMWNGFGIFSREGISKEFGKLVNAEGGKEKATPDDKASSTRIARKIKSKFSKAWISFLRLPLPLDVYKEVLANLHQTVIPHLSNPLMLCDFLMRSYDIGGVVSVMALSSLFVLMTQNGLEYPNFYEKLYALLEPSIFMAKYRAKFFQLVDSCLKSPLLPAYLAASFCKRLSRLALSVPPSGALIIIALVHNLLRRHPSINFLVHLEDVDETAKETSATEPKNEDVSANELHCRKDTCSSKPGLDHFNNEQSDPIKTNAMRSSLWEVDTLRHHYCPPVSRFILSLENDLTVRAKTSEVAVKDFSSGSYATIFNEEIRRRVKQVPLAFYKATPHALFSDADFPGWSFKCNVEEPISENATEGQADPSMKRQRVALVFLELSAKKWHDMHGLKSVTLHRGIKNILLAVRVFVVILMEQKVEPKGKVCVTGASGFLASWLIKRLLLSGYHVTGTVRDPGNARKVAHLWKLEGAKERLRLVKGDLLDEGSFDDAVKGCEGVFHTASPVLGLPSSDPKVEILKPAIDGTMNVLNSCKKNPALKRIVLTSSSSTVRVRDDFDPNVPLDESFWSSEELCEKLQAWYALSKTLAEKVAWKFCEENKIDLVAVLPSFVVGPSLPPELSSTAADILGLLRGESQKFGWHGRMGYVHIDDVALCHILVYEHKDAWGRYLCSSTVLDNHQLASVLSACYPRLPIPARFQRQQRPHYDFNTTKLESLGFKFKSIEEMFDDCISSLTEQGYLSFAK